MCDRWTTQATFGLKVTTLHLSLLTYAMNIPGIGLQ